MSSQSYLLFGKNQKTYIANYLYHGLIEIMEPNTKRMDKMVWVRILGVTVFLFISIKLGWLP